MISRRYARLTISAILAVSMLLVLTAAASADSQVAKWKGVGGVIFVGPSIDPALPTTTSAEFKQARDGSIKRVKITTQNEVVGGFLGQPGGGSAVTHCQDRRKSDACENLDLLITGAMINSIHQSTATLRDITEGIISLPVVTPGGPVVIDIPVLSGSLRGKLSGQFTLSNGTGLMTGTADLRITKASTGTYACFQDVNGNIVPLPTLQPCIDDTGGMLFPILLDIVDRGRFKLDPGTGSLEDLLGLAGRVEVHATGDLLSLQFGGEIVIPGAKATLAVD